MSGAPDDRDPGEDAELIEAVAGAWRPVDSRQIDVRFHPAWYDLDEAGRRRAHEVAAELRALEAALDPAGLSTTARAVIARVTGRAR
jgi:hypothetical protein